MKKLLAIVVLGLLWSNNLLAVTLDITKKEYVPEGYETGEKVINHQGETMYYSEIDKKFLTCDEFRDKDLSISEKLAKEGDRFFGGRPICDGEEAVITENGETYKAIFDFKTKKYIRKKSLIDRIKKSEHTPLIILMTIIFGLGVLIFKFRINIKKFLKPQIDFFKRNKVKIFGTLSIIYLCIMLWLNWLGHQGFFVYEMTYTWFLGWGVVPVLALWSLYFIWKKNE
mgnify:CR=1 FL=1|jgi:hypothetical protein